MIYTALPIFTTSFPIDLLHRHHQLVSIITIADGFGKLSSLQYRTLISKSENHTFCPVLITVGPVPHLLIEISTDLKSASILIADTDNSSSILLVSLQSSLFQPPLIYTTTKMNISYIDVSLLSSLIGSTVVYYKYEERCSEPSTGSFLKDSFLDAAAIIRNTVNRWLAITTSLLWYCLALFIYKMAKARPGGEFVVELYSSWGDVLWLVVGTTGVYAIWTFWCWDWERFETKMMERKIRYTRIMEEEMQGKMLLGPQGNLGFLD